MGWQDTMTYVNLDLVFFSAAHKRWNVGKAFRSLPFFQSTLTVAAVYVAVGNGLITIRIV